MTSQMLDDFITFTQSLQALISFGLPRNFIFNFVFSPSCMHTINFSFPFQLWLVNLQKLLTLKLQVGDLDFLKANPNSDKPTNIQISQEQIFLRCNLLFLILKQFLILIKSDQLFCWNRQLHVEKFLLSFLSENFLRHITYHKYHNIAVIFKKILNYNCRWYLYNIHKYITIEIIVCCPDRWNFYSNIHLSQYLKSGQLSIIFH